MSTTHDPQKVLGDLRDHLARHDKPIAFLFGAGTSCAVRVTDGTGTKPLIPAVPGVTTACKDDAIKLGAAFGKAWDLLEGRCKDAKLDPHVENILTLLRKMLGAIGKGDKLCDLDGVQLKALEEQVRKTIARVVAPDLSGLPADTPHRKLARWLARSSRRSCVEIFTVNYDVLVEHALEAERVPLFDGFVGSYQPFFHADSLRRPETAPGASWVRLWKMHGSVTWRRIVQDGVPRVIRGAPDTAGEMILPSFQKYDESRLQPYAAFTDRLTRFLEQDDALLVVAGFSFGDEHINNLIFAALENRPRTHVYALQFDDPKPDCDLIKRASLRNNLVVLAPTFGVIGAQNGTWLANDAATFVGASFEPDAGAAAGAGKPGKMKVGDFARFGDFLKAMGG